MTVANRENEPFRLRSLDEENPWPGLAPFDTADRRFFKGREREADLLHRMVQREIVTVLFGKSGLGKSSLLQAGLFPLLDDESLPVYVRFDFSTARPRLGAQVKEAIAGSAADAGVEAPESVDAESLWEYLHRRDNDFWSRRNRLVVPLLVFDQFEELFTLGRRGPTRAEATETFISELADLVEGAPPRELLERVEREPREAERFDFELHDYKVILTLREDFLPDLEELRPRMVSIGRNRFRLRHMKGDSALRVVRQVPELISEEVAARVVRFVAAAGDPSEQMSALAVEPALLSLFLRELNERRKKKGRATITEDDFEGSREAILTDFYERSTGDMPSVRSFVEEKLLTPSGERDSVALETALAAGISREAIATLEDRRLVRIEKSGRQDRLELTHDRLTEVVVRSRDDRRRREQEEEEREKRRVAESEARSARRQRNLVVALLGLAILGFVISWAALKGKERAQRQRLAAVKAQLESRDPGTVVRAVEELVNSLEQDVDAMLGLIPADQLRSNEWLARLVLALDRNPGQPGRQGWASEVRAALGEAISRAKGIPPPPHREVDEGLNPRVRIEGGSFSMGSHPGAGREDERPQREVTLSEFWIQQHEVTREEYRRFDLAREFPEGSDRLPATRVDWFDAMAYAAWLGGSLPTESQWEFAARGAAGRTYPWGEEAPSRERANFGQDSGAPAVVLGHPKGATLEGVHDLAGNVWEWCRDWYGDYPKGAEENPLGPEEPKEGRPRRVRRGGSFAVESGAALRAASRSPFLATFTDDDTGFRVAWTEMK